MVNCWQCNEVASVKRSRNGAAECVTCFTDAFETEVYNVITTHNLFKKGQKVAVGASGGKDSTVLIHVLNKLNQKYKYGLDIILLSVDEGIAGYRDESLESVQRNKSDYGLPLVIISYRELYGWTMDEVVSAVGIKNNCTFCGVFRRRALDRTAAVHGADVIATGHNADDMAETVLLNILRGDIARLQRCTDIITAWEEGLPRVKPLKYAFEKDIVMYAHFNKLDYFSTECKYSPDSFRSYVRAYVKELERLQPRAILDLIKSGEAISARSDTPLPTITTCEKCGCMSSQKICKTCKLLQGLSDGNYDLGVKKRARNATNVDLNLHMKCDCEKNDRKFCF